MESPQGWQALSSISAFMQHVESRRQLKVFGELDARLDYCEYLIRRQSNKNEIKRFRSKKRKDEVGDDLVRALQSLSFQQLIRHFNKLVEQLVQLTLNVLSPPVIESRSFIICEAYSRTYSLRMWKKKKLRFDRENHILYAEKDKKIKIYDLANYIVRSSEKTDYFGLALEAVNNTPLERSKSAHFGFEYKNTYNLWLTSIQRSVDYKQWEALVVTLNKEQLMVKRNAAERQGKDKEWERLNKTEGHCNVNEEVGVQEMQSAIYIPPPPREEDANQTTTTKGNNASRNEEDEESVLTTSFKVEQEADFEAILKESHVHKLTHFDSVYSSLQDLQFQLQTEEEGLKKSKLQLSFANAIIDQYDRNSTQQEKNKETFDEILLEDLTSVKAFQDKQKSSHFKLLFTISLNESIQTKDIVQSFLNLDLYKVINPTISSCSTKATIYSQNSTLVHEQHHSYNRLYRPRQFYYIRHLTRTIHNEFLLIDRSITNSVPVPSNSTHVKGDLTNVYKICSDQESVTLEADIQFHHCGGINQAQNISLTKKYIIGLARGLCQHLSSSLDQVSPSKYYNLETHSKHAPIPLPSNHPHLIFDQGIGEQHPSSTLDADTRPKPKASFYRIARNQIIQNTSLTESFFGDEEPQLPPAHFRRTLSPNRNTYIENRSSMVTQERTAAQEEWDVVMESQVRDEWRVDEERGGMVMKRILRPREREVMKRIIEAAVKKALLGKDVDEMSFPVDILAPQTQLQRLMSQLSCAPALLTEISHLTTMQKLIRTVTFGLQVSLLSLYDERAFSSTLGETYQCNLSPQCSGYAQQISVSPGISALYLVGKGFSLSAVLRQRFRMAMNNVSWKDEGVYRVQLGEDEVCFTTPLVVLNGITLSRREFLLQERSFYWIEGKNMLLQLNFEPTNSFSQAHVKRDYFQGTIHEVTPQFMQQFLSDRQPPPDQHIVRVLGKITGRWTKDLHFQDYSISLSEVPLSNMESSSAPLPSDSCCRMDVLSLREGRLEQSQTLKDALEESQRRDAGLRLGFPP